MRKSGKKLLSFMTAGLLMLQTFSIPSGNILAQSSDQIAAQEDSSNIVDSGVCGDDLTWTLDSDGVLFISGTGELYYDYESCWDKLSVNSCIIDYGVTSIGEQAFYSCSLLTSIDIPDSVTTIGDGAFDDCDKLETVYYAGSEEQWNQIKIYSYNDPLLNADIVFNCSPKSDTDLVVDSDTDPVADSNTDPVVGAGGDINGDGKVNAKDLTRLMKHIADEEAELVGVADINGDGKVNSKDLTRLMKNIAGTDRKKAEFTVKIEFAKR